MDKKNKSKTLDLIEKQHERELTEAFKIARNNIKYEIALLEEKGLLTYNDMQKYNRLKALQDIVTQELTTMAKITGQTLTAEQMALYDTARKTTLDVIGSEINLKLDITLLPKTAIKEAIKNPLDLVGYVQRNANNAAAIVQKINQDIITALVQGKGYTKIATALNDRFNQGYANSLRIARTESHRNREAGTLRGYEEAEKLGLVIYKIWKSANIPGRTRDWHSEADGQEVRVDEPFIVNGEELMYPGDPAGSAENVINCLCTMITRVENPKTNLEITKK